MKKIYQEKLFYLLKNVKENDKEEFYNGIES